MTREEFIKVLDEKRYSYEIQGDKIVVTGKLQVDMESLTSLPPGVVFRNQGSVYLEALTSLPPGAVFDNAGNVFLNSITSLPPGVVFRNQGHVYLPFIDSIPTGVVFNNEWDVYLPSLIGNWFKDSVCNIRGIESNSLLNIMIKKGVFKR
jgi:hypothetical protein